MANRARMIVEVPETSVDINYGTLGNALETIQSLIEAYGSDARIDYYQAPYSESQYLYVYVKRQESDDEYNARIANEERWERQGEEKDRQEYERLQRKFGSPV
jgi:hypothetical protein